MRLRYLWPFLLLTFGISWGIPGALLLVAPPGDIDLRPYSPLSYIVVWAPSLAALFLVGWFGGRRVLRAFLRRLGRFSGHWKYYVAVLIGFPALKWLAAWLSELTGLPGLEASASTVSTPEFLGAALLVATMGPLEEFGWRGYALPLLQRSFSGLQAAVILGLIWMTWHLPGFFLETVMTDALQLPVLWALPPFFLDGIAFTIILTVLYNVSRGSVPLMVVAHWLHNLPYPFEADPSISPMNSVLMVLLALFLMTRYGRSYLGFRNLQTDLF